MKFGLVALASTLLFVTGGLAQEEKVFQPPYVSVFYFLRASGEGLDLERKTPNVRSKGDRFLFVIPGEKSPVRLSAGEKMQFVVRVAEDFDRAKATMQLFRFDGGNGTRQVLLKIRDVRSNKAGVPLIAEKYGDSSLKVAPSEPLAPGEYCLSRSTISQGYCFGVDAVVGE